MKPDVNQSGISIIETDLEVDFEAPLGYVEPERIAKKTDIEKHVIRDDAFVALSGAGQTVKGRIVESAVKDSGAPDALILPFGTLYFGYPLVPLKDSTPKIEAFTGEGKTLRKKNK